MSNQKIANPLILFNFINSAILALFFIFLCFPAYSENLGVYGQVYSIAEPDLLHFIHQRLLQFQNDGRLKKMETDFQKRVEEHVIRPTPVSFVSDAKKTSKEKTLYFTPQFTLQKNIYDSTGKLLFSAGTSVNPLNQEEVKKIAPNAVIPEFNETLIFIDADQKSQVEWTQSEIKSISGIYKIILVKGNLKKASNALGRIYFDQAGALCHLFHIDRVPAVVTRSGVQLKIKELPV